MAGRIAMTRLTSQLLAPAALAVAIGAQAIGAAAAQQQTYPTRTVQLILPYGAASATDITARLFADKVKKLWGKPVVVENCPGGDWHRLAQLRARCARRPYTLDGTGRSDQRAPLRARHIALRHEPRFRPRR